MSGWRVAFVLGLIPIVVAVIYATVQGLGTLHQKDLAGVTMLAALGLAMGFGFFVILRGARDL